MDKGEIGSSSAWSRGGREGLPCWRGRREIERVEGRESAFDGAAGVEVEGGLVRKEVNEEDVVRESA